MIKQVIKLSKMRRFAAEIFDRAEEAEKAAAILMGIPEARSPRISNISHAMEGNPDADYKAIQRFLAHNDPREALNRFYLEQTPFVIGDPTDIGRYQAKKTEYVGKLKDGKTPGFRIMPSAFPCRGRAIPFHFITYSSKTIENESASGNLENSRLIREMKDIPGRKPLVPDREFSYEGLFEDFVEEGMKFVSRLNSGNKATIRNADGGKVMLSVCPGGRVSTKGK